MAVHPILQALLEQRANGFSAFGGTDITATVAVSDVWANDQIARVLPADGVVRGLQLRSRPGDEIGAHLRVAKGSLALPIDMVLAIESQPELPHRPVLGLRVTRAPRFLGLGGPLLRAANALPAGIAIDGDRVTLDLAALLETYGAGDALRYLTDLRVATADGALLLTLRLRID